VTFVVVVRQASDSGSFAEVAVVTGLRRNTSKPTEEVNGLLEAAADYAFAGILVIPTSPLSFLKKSSSMGLLFLDISLIKKHGKLIEHA
jgi:hypothetical protein